MSHSLLKRALPALPRSPSAAAAARCLASVTTLEESSTGVAAQAARAAAMAHIPSAVAGPSVVVPRPNLSMQQLLPALKFSNAEIQNAIEHLEQKGLGHRSLTWDQRVVWGDHDQFGHVNHVRYVNWFESAKAFFFNQIFGPDSIRPGGSGLSIIMGNLNIRFRRPVQGSDTILIGQGAVFPLERPDRFILRGTAYSLTQRDVVSTADQLCVIYDYEQNKSVKIPEMQLNLLKEYAVRS